MLTIGARRAITAGSRKTLDQLVAGIFASASGTWLDASDPATRFQDSLGASLAGAGQAVGLVLDKRFGLALGPEIVLNGTFADATGWILPSGSGVSGGKLRLSVPTSAATSSYVVEAAKRYKWTADVSEYVSGTLNLHFGGATRALGSNGSYSGISSLTNSTTPVRFLTTGSPVAALDNLSVREQLGNHAAQTTATARPLFQPGPDRFVLDGIDDVLVVQLPAAGLGNNCTVVTSVPGVGAQLLTGQVIGASHSITSSFCARLLIDRPLSAAETLAVTRWANQKAGL